MQITYSLNEQDVYEGQKAHGEGATRLTRFAYRGFFWILGLLLVGLGSFFIWFGRATLGLGIILLVVGIVYCFGGPFLRREVAARYFRKNPNLQKEYTIEFSEDGTVGRAPGLHSEVGWSHFQKWRESDSVFLVYVNTRVYAIYPKRSFKQDEISEFRDLLKRKIPRG